MKAHGIFRNLFVCTALALVTMMAFDVKADLIVAYNIEAASPSAAIFTNANVSVSDLVFSATGVNGTADWLPVNVAYKTTFTESDTPTTNDITVTWSVTPINNATLTLDAIGGATAGMRVYEQGTDATAYGKLFVASDAAFTTILAESDIVSSYSASSAGPVTNASINSAVSSESTLYFGFALTYIKNGNAQIRFDDFKVNGEIIQNSSLVELSNDTIASNAAPGALVGYLSDPVGAATSFVLTNAPAGGSDADNDKFQITDGTNLRTRVWMSQYANDVSIAGISNGVALTTNSFEITLTAATDSDPAFRVSAEVSDSPTDGTIVGAMTVDNDGSATFTIVSGRTDLFTQDASDNLLVTNAASWGGVGTTNWVTIRATTGTGSSDLAVGVAVVSGSTVTQGTIFLFH